MPEALALSPPALRSARPAAWLLALGLWVAVTVVAFGVGKFAISPSDLIASLAARLTGGVSPLSASAEAVIWHVRGPRVLAAALVACRQEAPQVPSATPAPADPGDAWAKLGTVAGGVDGNPRPASGLAGPNGLPVGSWGVSPGRAKKNAVAIWARSAGLIGASGASGTPTEVEGMLLTADYL